MAGVVDEVATRILADWFNCDELATALQFLQITEVYTKHKNTVKMDQGQRAYHREGIGAPGELVWPVIERVCHTLGIRI